jgi:prephenate dehydrogenase
MMFKKLCIIGVGLIGGSIALAARKNNLCSNIVGFGRAGSKDNLIYAQTNGIIDSYCLELETAVQDADCIIIATPVGATEAVLARLKNCWSDTAVYTDVGSTKASVVEAAEKVFGFIPKNFVPAHPIAGAEQSGAQAAISDLFKDKRLIITPTKVTSAESLSLVQDFWQVLGASVSIMDIKHHDAVLAATSHLPHVLAFALVDLLAKKDEQNEIFKYAAGGFKDFTRIASSDPGMWLDICLANKIEIVKLIQQFQGELENITQILEQNDRQQLFDIFSNAKNARQHFLKLYEK